MAQGSIRVRESVELGASPDEVWRAIGGFGALAEWHPLVARCDTQEEQGGPYRMLETGDGAKLFERLLAHDEAGRNYSYSIIESPLPVAEYEATIQVEQAGGGSRVVWESRFQPEGASLAEARQAIAGIYRAGLDALKSRFG